MQKLTRSQLYTTHSKQVSCILLRNTSATDSTDKFPFDTSGFENIPQERYMFFRTPDDLVDIDVTSGGCYNESVQQNVTFSYQNLPFGFGEENEDGAVPGSTPGPLRALMVSLLVVGVCLLMT